MALDLHSAILLRLKPSADTARAQTRIWLVVTRAQDPPRWPQLCATLLAGFVPPDAH